MIQIIKPFLSSEDYPISQGFGQNPEVYQRFGMPAHNGLDYACPEGTKITACADGNVVKSELHTAYGNIVKIKHNGGYFSLCAHLSKRLVNVGENVKKGDLIALSGSTGYSTGPHLHFGIQSVIDGTQPYNYYTNPEPFFDNGKKKL